MADTTELLTKQRSVPLFQRKSVPPVHIQGCDGSVPLQDNSRKQAQGNAPVNLEDVIEVVQRFGNAAFVGVLVAKVSVEPVHLLLYLLGLRK